MNLHRIVANTSKLLKSNAPQILTGGTVVGVIGTAYLAAKGGMKASRILDKEQRNARIRPDLPLPKKAQIQLTWKCYVPAVIVGGATVASAIGSQKMMGKRAAVAATAYSVMEREFAEYRNKVVEELGKGKEDKIRNEIAQEKVRQTTATEIIQIGEGTQLCCELWTMRYFRSSRESLDRAVAEINRRMITDMYVTLDEFYELIGLDYTSQSHHLGWDGSRPMEIKIQAVMGPNGDPCLAFDYEGGMKPL